VLPHTMCDAAIGHMCQAGGYYPGFANGTASIMRVLDERTAQLYPVWHELFLSLSRINQGVTRAL